MAILESLKRAAVDAIGGGKAGFSSSASLRFPNDITGHPVWMRISIYDVHSTLSEADKKKIGESVSSTNVKELVSKRTTAGLTPKNVVFLHMPTGVNFNDTNNFDTTDLGFFGSMAEGGVEKAAAADGTNKDVSAMGILKELGVAAGTMAAKSNIPGIDGLVSRALIRAGVVSNPRTELLYKAPSIRQFAFQWKLMPSDPGEAKTIANMIQILRAASYPTITKGLGSVYQFPLTFKVEFIRNTGSLSTKGASLDTIMKLPALYLTNVSTTYNPTSPAFFADGNPVEVDLALTFQEHEPLDSAKIREEGY